MKRRTSAQVEKQIDKVIDKINKKIAESTQDSVYSRGLANEGYLGGYVQALSDVDYFLRGMIPNKNDFWKEDE